ncbi:Aldo/keto reductase [Dendrothele bispora CBS 962.96]|uniref:Aldo/keto reductase n=1 Tax=Dendrothele bispora (strain CBS 962.96) TaxID=1314807 RepID=A0A4S8M5U6_DENBC|nr:Aldo/keto reductase [Dendrothele bispora CBS 962.96]
MAPLTISSTLKLPTGQEMPLLGLGVYKNDDPYPACEAALKCGYKHIDTAEMYGNEKTVGDAVKASGIPRESLFITSKVWSGGDKTANTVQQSLKNLDLGYINLYLIHAGHGGKEHRLKTWKTLTEFAGPDKPLRAIGVSNYSPRHLEEIREAGLPMPAVNQIELHPFDQQKPIVDYCKKHNIVVSAYCPLVRGAFDNSVLQELSKEYNKTPAQVLVRWSLQRGFIPLPKSSNPERVRSNADIYDFELSDAAMAKLDALDKGDAGAISWNPIDVD